MARIMEAAQYARETGQQLTGNVAGKVVVVDAVDWPVAEYLEKLRATQQTEEEAPNA